MNFASLATLLGKSGLHAPYEASGGDIWDQKKVLNMRRVEPIDQFVLSGPLACQCQTATRD